MNAALPPDVAAAIRRVLGWLPWCAGTVGIGDEPEVCDPCADALVGFQIDGERIPAGLDPGKTSCWPRPTFRPFATTPEEDP